MRPHKGPMKEAIAYDTSSDITLTRQASGGDILAESVLACRNSVRQLVRDAATLPLDGICVEVPIVGGLDLVFLPTSDGTVDMLIRSNSQNQITRCWPAITAWRKFLEQTQGVKKPYRPVVVDAYLMWRRDKKSSATIAKYFNEKAVWMLRRHVETSTSIEQSKMTPATFQAWEEDGLDFSKPSICYLAYVMLKELGASPVEAEKHCWGAINQLFDGESVTADKDYPLEPEQVRDTLRYFEKQNPVAIRASA